MVNFDFDVSLDLSLPEISLDVSLPAVQIGMSSASPLSATKDPTAAFRFVVEIANTAIGAFTECEMPAFEVETQEIKEGGLNTYTHTLAGPVKQGKLTLKHGIMKNDMLLRWYLQVMTGDLGESALNTVAIVMYGNDFQPLYRFEFDRCLPIKWQGPSFKAGDSAVAVETIELAHQGITVFVGS